MGEIKERSKHVGYCRAIVTKETKTKLKTTFGKQNAEAVAQRYSVKKALFEISENSKENTCVRVSFLIKLQAWGFPYRTPFVAASENTILLW